MNAALLALALLGPTYVERQELWRADRAASLMRERGWLSVAGLFWLKEGSNTLGSDPKSDFVLPSGSPPSAGTLELHGGKVTYRQGSDSQELRTDADGNPPITKVGDASFILIKRGQRVGVRLYDPNRKVRREFRGLHWFPVNPAYVVRARFVPYPKPRQLMITNVLGDTAPVASPGYAQFVLSGKTCRLVAEDAGDELFFNFRDTTSGKTTYPAGRFLDAPKAKDGWVTLDFNQATNPPCAYTEFATCPLPPRENILRVPIPAGEQKFHE